MKKHIIILVLICAFAARPCSAQDAMQTSKVLDTIYANDAKNVALFFPEPIRQGITGSDNFIFTYNRENEQYFGLLQAKPGKESNLLVINNDGSVFSYIVRYRSELSTLNYFVPMSNSIGNEKPVAKDSIAIGTVANSVDYASNYYDKFSAYLLDKKQRIGRIKHQTEGIGLKVETIVFDKEELYFVIQIENKSTLDYDLDFLKLATEIRQKGKKKSLQRLYKEPMLKYNLPTKIGKNETARFVYVLSKFSISKDRRVILKLNEKNGERHVELKVSHRFINNPN